MLDSTTCGQGSQSSGFRILDLPLELREKVYKELLCNFEPAPSHGINDLVAPKPNGHFVRSIKTHILRVNKQIYYEAYSVMVKTNRFIHCKFFGSLPLGQLLETSTRRILCQYQKWVEAFKGYAMAVTVTPSGVERCDADGNNGIPVSISKEKATHCMILGEDCPGLIKMLCDVHMPNMGKTLNISIAVAPYLKVRSPIERELLERFFNELGTQESLLAPFHEKMRGIQDVEITGVKRSFARMVEEDIAKDEWTDYDAVLSDLRTVKQSGNDLFKAKELRRASQIWEEAVDNIERMHQGSSWPKLCSKGGDAFLDAVAELYFLMCLNITHIQLTGIDKPIPGYPETQDKFDYLSLAEQQIDRILFACELHWWRRDYTWEPSETQRTKLLFRQALCMKTHSIMFRQPQLMLDALQVLKMVKDIVPDDAAVRREVARVESEYERMIMAMTAEELEEIGVFSDMEDNDEYGYDDYDWDFEDEEDEEYEFYDEHYLSGQRDLEEDEYADMPSLL